MNLVFNILALVTSCQRGLPPLSCAVGHAAPFAMNVVLVASQWQRRA